MINCWKEWDSEWIETVVLPQKHIHRSTNLSAVIEGKKKKKNKERPKKCSFHFYLQFWPSYWFSCRISQRWSFPLTTNSHSHTVENSCGWADTNKGWWWWWGFKSVNPLFSLQSSNGSLQTVFQTIHTLFYRVLKLWAGFWKGLQLINPLVNESLINQFKTSSFQFDFKDKNHALLRIDCVWKL